MQCICLAIQTEEVELFAGHMSCSLLSPQGLYMEQWVLVWQLFLILLHKAQLSS